MEGPDGGFPTPGSELGLPHTRVKKASTNQILCSRQLISISHHISSFQQGFSHRTFTKTWRFRLFKSHGEDILERKMNVSVDTHIMLGIDGDKMRDAPFK